MSEAKYECKVCGYRGNTKEEMREHVGKHQGALKRTKEGRGIFRGTKEGSPYLIGYDRSVYYFSKESIVKIKTVPSSYWLAWAIIIEAITIVFFGWVVGGVIGVIPLYIVPKFLLKTFVGEPREKKLANLSFDELKTEKGAKQISWSDITKARINSQRLDIYLGRMSSTVLTLDTSSTLALELLKPKLGSKLVEK